MTPTATEFRAVHEHFGLPSAALVEKDWYVAKALTAIAAVNAAPFRLVFERMSEDIDLKIISAEEPTVNVEDLSNAIAERQAALRR